MTNAIVTRPSDFSSGTFDFDTFRAAAEIRLIVSTASISNGPDGMTAGDVSVQYIGTDTDGMQVAQVINSTPSGVTKGIWHRRRASSVWGSWQEPAPNIFATENGARAATSTTQIMSPQRVRAGTAPTSTALPGTPETPFHLLIGGSGTPADGLYVNNSGTWLLVIGFGG